MSETPEYPFPNPWEKVHTNLDGTSLPYDRTHTNLREITPQGTDREICPGEVLDDFSALQIGMYRILEQLVFTTVNRRALVDSQGQDIRVNEMQFQRIFLDWPNTENDMIPVPSATILAPAEQSTTLGEAPQGGQQILEETADLFAPNTVLRKFGETIVDLQVQMLLNNKDDRAGVRKGLIDAFMAEPDDERAGRRVLVPEYFSRVARFSLVGMDYPDTPDDAKMKHFPLTARFVADIEMVKLVQLPTELLTPRIDVQVT